MNKKGLETSHGEKTAVQQQYLGTLRCTNVAPVQENIPYMTPPPAATADTGPNESMLFTQKFCPANSMLQKKPGGVLSLRNHPLLLMITRCTMIFLL